MKSTKQGKRILLTGHSHTSPTKTEQYKEVETVLTHLKPGMRFGVEFTPEGLRNVEQHLDNLGKCVSNEFLERPTRIVFDAILRHDLGLGGQNKTTAISVDHLLAAIARRKGARLVPLDKHRAREKHGKILQRAERVLAGDLIIAQEAIRQKCDIVSVGSSHVEGMQRIFEAKGMQTHLVYYKRPMGETGRVTWEHYFRKLRAHGFKGKKALRVMRKHSQRK
jgi:hypothetical protein